MPTESAATLARRTQQVVAFETGLTSTVDPCRVVCRGAAHRRARVLDLGLLEHLEERGGALACIESGEFARKLSDAAYRHTLAVESGERTVVGVDRSRPVPGPRGVPHRPRLGGSPGAGGPRGASRDATAVKRALEWLRTDVAEGRSVMPATIEAVRAHATIGQIVDVLREAHGRWVPSAAF